VSSALPAIGRTVDPLRVDAPRLGLGVKAVQYQLHERLGAVGFDIDKTRQNQFAVLREIGGVKSLDDFTPALAADFQAVVLAVPDL